MNVFCADLLETGRLDLDDLDKSNDAALHFQREVSFGYTLLISARLNDSTPPPVTTHFGFPWCSIWPLVSRLHSQH